MWQLVPVFFDVKMLQKSVFSVVIWFLIWGIKIEIHAVQGLSTWSYYQVILCLVSVFILKDLANVIVDWFMTTFIPVYSPLFYRAKYEFSADLGDLKNNKNLDMKEIFIKSKEKQLGQARGAFKQKLNSNYHLQFKKYDSFWNESSSFHD